MRYGLATLGNKLEDLDSVLDKQNYQVLPLLSVNRNVRKALRTPPRAFGGIGLFDLPVEQTIGWINMFLQHYGVDSVLGGKFRASLEALQLELGCVGCPLRERFEVYGCLATPCWMTSFWERLQHFQFHIHTTYPSLTAPREGDKALTALFVDQGYTGERLCMLNRCRLALRAMFLSDLVCANGRCFVASDNEAFENLATRKA